MHYLLQIFRGENKNGWFVGVVQDDVGTYYFAINILGTKDASGVKAKEITHNILRTKGIRR